MGLWKAYLNTECKWDKETGEGSKVGEVWKKNIRYFKSLERRWKVGNLGDTCRKTKVENVNKVCVEEEIQRSGKCRSKKRRHIMERAGKILIL